MTNAARTLIEDIAAELNDYSLPRIKAALEDGSILAGKDQETVEGAHDMVSMWMRNGVDEMA